MTRPVVPDPPADRPFRNESALRDAARAYLTTIPRSKVIKHHGEAMSEAGIPDTEFVWLGLSVWFEWKIPGRRGRRIQDIQRRRLIYAGSPSFLATSLRDVKAALDTIIGERLIDVDGRPAWLILTPEADDDRRNEATDREGRPSDHGRGGRGAGRHRGAAR